MKLDETKFELMKQTSLLEFYQWLEDLKNDTAEVDEDKDIPNLPRAADRMRKLGAACSDLVKVFIATEKSA